MDDRLKDLLLKYLNRTCTEAERDELLAKLRFLPHSENLDEVLGELWEEESVDLIELEWDQLQELHDRKSSIKRSEEHTSELQSRGQLVCRLLLEKTNKT